MITDFTTKLSKETKKPGVYLMKDADEKVIYVGKAKNLRKRLASYFKNAERLDRKTRILVTNIASFETIVTGSEHEALMLESNLIKRYRPKFNVILKDDKRYPWLKLDITHQWPNLYIVRRIEKDGALYFGPYTSPSAVHKTLKVIRKTYQLRKCSSRNFIGRTRPCLNFQICACRGPCCREVDKKHYDIMVKEIILFLKGRTSALVKKIRAQMMEAAKEEDFELAASLRDKMFALEKTLEKQSVVSSDFIDRDVIGVAESHNFSVIILLSIRAGYLTGSRHFTFAQTIASGSELVETFIRQYYGHYDSDKNIENKIARFIPKEIIVPAIIEDAALHEERLSIVKGRKVKILHPVRGEKVRILEMAGKNAKNRLDDLTDENAAVLDLLGRLKQRLNMDQMPERIECFDNSNISGTNPVAGMVVFENGVPAKSEYRKYRIKTVIGPDDYASMFEVLKRRFANKKSFPDLLMVDGGRGQLNMALAVMKELKIEDVFSVVGIAKKDEKKGEPDDKIYMPGRINPVNFGKDKDALFFLMRIRDESHRFAITFHRQTRGRQAVRSILDEIPGIGKKRKKMLIRHFGSIKKIRAAAQEELSRLPGIGTELAETIKTTLDREKPTGSLPIKNPDSKPGGKPG
ncbi:excinuclease ABC subunit UvrC [Desulfobacterales bacterium HSG16]|nr:excinuclease ABC subunit UvrC [Desulfobacterales bacterium HSG16]